MTFATDAHNDFFDEVAFDDVYYRAGMSAAQRLGIIVSKGPDDRLTAQQRVFRTTAHAQAARAHVVDVQESLLDDDSLVRTAARAGLRDVLHRLYTGDHDDRDRAPAHTRRPDKWIARLLGRPNPDALEPWWCDAGHQNSIRWSAILLACVTAGFASAALAMDLPVVALPLIILTGLIDVTEGAFARVVELRSAELRWVSCLASHSSDLLLFASIVTALLLTGESVAPVILAAGMLVALFGSFVRVSALQAGYRFWVSPAERWVRYAGLLGYCFASAAGVGSVAAVSLAALIGGFGLYEAGRIVRAVITGPTIQSGGFVFVNAEHVVVSEWLIDRVDAPLSVPADDSTTTPRYERRRRPIPV